MYPAKTHAERVVATYQRLTNREVTFNILVSACKAQLWPHSDMEVRFRQDRYFNYLTGAFDLKDAVVVYYTAPQKLVLYLPEVDEDSVMWSGLPLSPEDAKALYDVDEVHYITDLNVQAGTFAGELRREFRSLEQYPEFKDSVTADASLKEAFDEARVIKDEYEIQLIRRANQISDKCHLAVMSALPIETNERHIHAEFAYHAIRQGSKYEAYDPICCSGTNAGTLHYVKNDEELKNRQLVLLDAGAEFECYASDITRCFPINGHWSPEARQIYDLVHEMQRECMVRVRPGVEWSDLHLLAHRILIDRFLQLGIFKRKYTPVQLFQSGVSAAFLPHGLGHMLGMDTHDSGGHANYEDPDPKLRYLRIRRKLETNMVVTVEPGCYFNDFLIEKLGANGAHMIDFDVLEKYKPVGGVRIEDDVLVTSTGYENLTSVTSDADEIERIVQTGLARDPSAYHNLV